MCVCVCVHVCVRAYVCAPDLESQSLSGQDSVGKEFRRGAGVPADLSESAVTLRSDQRSGSLCAFSTQGRLTVDR